MCDINKGGSLQKRQTSQVAFCKAKVAGKIKSSYLKYGQKSQKTHKENQKTFFLPTTTNGSVIQNASWHLEHSRWPERKYIFKPLAHWEHTDVQYSYICAL